MMGMSCMSTKVRSGRAGEAGRHRNLRTMENVSGSMRQG